jgi:hypothetical protein
MSTAAVFPWGTAAVAWSWPLTSSSSRLWLSRAILLLSPLHDLYRLGDSGFEPRLGPDISWPSRPDPRCTQPLAQRVPGLFIGSKAAGAWRCPFTSVYRRC